MKLFKTHSYIKIHVIKDPRGNSYILDIPYVITLSIKNKEQINDSLGYEGCLYNVIEKDKNYIVAKLDESFLRNNSNLTIL